MNRLSIEKLKDWLGDLSDRKPLILRGARQVGKSTLVQQFAAQMALRLNEVNLEKHQKMNRVFAELDVAKAVRQLEALPNMPGLGEGSLLFLDEIQATPFALPLLRYFHEELKAQPVLGAGSLLEFLLGDHKFSMPVGRVRYLHLGPMTFREFLQAVGEFKLEEVLRSFNPFDLDPRQTQIGTIEHQRLQEHLRLYFFIGGMPEAVSVFAQTRKLKKVRDVQRSILDTYREDFPKYSGNKDTLRIVSIFDQIPMQLCKKIKYANFSKDHSSATVKSDLSLFINARIVQKVTRSHCNGLPLSAEADTSIFKLIHLDLGLLNASLGLPWDDISSYSDTTWINEGLLAEQFIGQHLVDQIRNRFGSELHYWLREGKETNAEIDYVIQHNGKILPIEVKAGASGSLKSLHHFMYEKKLEIALRFDTNPPKRYQISTKINTKFGVQEVKYTLISLPLYLVESVWNKDDLEFINN